MEEKSTGPERGAREDAYTRDNLSRFKSPSAGKARGHLVHGIFADREHCVNIQTTVSDFRKGTFIDDKLGIRHHVTVLQTHYDSYSTFALLRAQTVDGFFISLLLISTTYNLQESSPAPSQKNNSKSVYIFKYSNNGMLVTPIIRCF